VDVDADGGCVVCLEAAAAEEGEGRGWDLGRVAEDRAVFRELSVVGVSGSLLNLAFAPMEQWRPVLALDPASVERARLANNARMYVVVRIKW
jgi:hypothetical protein